jgi:hypothetical protein
VRPLLSVLMIHVVEENLAHYRIPVYERLNERLGGELVVYHAKPSPRAHLHNAGADANLSFKRWQLRTLSIGSPVTAVSAVEIGNHPGISTTSDKTSITLEFADGSYGTVHYLANGYKSFPKERVASPIPVSCHVLRGWAQARDSQGVRARSVRPGDQLTTVPHYGPECWHCSDE